MDLETRAAQELDPLTFKRKPGSWQWAVLAAGILLGAILTEGISYWDGDFTIFFRAIDGKPLWKLLVDLVSPLSSDSRNWGFLDHTLQLVIYKASYMVVGYSSWPYVWLRIFVYAGIGWMIALWSMRLLPSEPRSKWTAGAVALLFLMAPGPTASMSWIADFAPFAEFAFASLSFLLWVEIERTPVDWTTFRFGDASVARRRWLLRWLGLALLLDLGYKTKGDVKLVVAVVAAYVVLVRPRQCRVFFPPLTIMALLAVPWNPGIFHRLPPFLPGSQGASESFMWQPAKLGRLMEFIWSSRPYDLQASSMSLAGQLGPFLLTALVIGYFIHPLPDGALPWRSTWRWWRETPRRRAHVFVALWLCAILAGATALPELSNYFFRIRYGIMPLLPVSVLLASAMAWLYSEGSVVPRWLLAVFALLFAAQVVLNADHAVRYRRELGRTEVGVDQAYAWIAKYYPNDDLLLMPGFLAYDYHLDAPKAIRLRRSVGNVGEVLALSRPNGATVLSWEPSPSPALKEVAQFTGCGATLFDWLVPCWSGYSIYAMRYQSAEGQPLSAGDYLDRSFAAWKDHRPWDAIAAAQEALRWSSGLAVAHNNIAAAYLELGMWDEAIMAAQEAIRLQPDYQLAKNNLAAAEAEKKRLGL